MSGRLALPLIRAEAPYPPISIGGLTCEIPAEEAFAERPSRTRLRSTLHRETKPAHSLGENYRKGPVLYGMVPYLVEKVKPFADWLPGALAFCPEFHESAKADETFG